MASEQVFDRPAPPALHKSNLSPELPGDVIALPGAHAKIRRDGYRTDHQVIQGMWGSGRPGRSGHDDRVLPLRGEPFPHARLYLDVVHNNADAHIVHGIIELAHGLGKQVVAEGVESQDAVNLLLLMGCDQGQGYHWSRPVPAGELTAWVTKHQHAVTVAGLEAGMSAGAPIPANEAKRLAVLQRYRILDTAYEAIFDEIATVAAQVCGTPMSAVSLVDAERQWFKARVGLRVAETTRDLAFCAHTIMDPAHLLVVNDATTDARFASNPLVTGDPGIRFYAGAPLVAPDGSAVGTLCVIDSKPRQLSGAQLDLLRQLAAHVIAMFEAKQQLAELAERRETPCQRDLRLAS